MKPTVPCTAVVLVALSLLAGGARAVCPEGFVRVPANPAMGTWQDFCVAKYEMKIVGDDDGDQAYTNSFAAESRASGTPWINMTMTQAREACAAMGPGYALINNAEWMTIARNIESVAANWSDNQAHAYEDTESRLCTGHTCREGWMGSSCRLDQTAYSGEGLPAATNDAEGCYGYVAMTNESAPPTLNSNGWNDYRRTFYLDNGEVIWDFAGNVWEWVDWYVPLAADRAWVDGVITTNDNEFAEINAPLPGAGMPEHAFKSSRRDLVPVTPPYTNINQNRFGRYHATDEDYTAGAAMRGGNFMHGSVNNGIYALGMGYGPDATTIVCRVGFRCVYHPWAADHDTDKDLVSDADERVAGTDPGDPTNVPHVTVVNTGGSVQVGIETVVPSGRGAPEYDRFYSLDRRESLVAGAWSAVPGYTNLPATGAPVLLEHPAGTDFFYRARIEAVPR